MKDRTQSSKAALKENALSITCELINDHLGMAYRESDFEIVMFCRLDDGWAAVTMLEDRESYRYLTIRSDSKDEVTIETYDRCGLMVLNGGGL